MKRRCVLLASVALVLSLGPHAGMANAGRKPNIVVIFADDLGYGSVSYNGGDVPTPNIDAFVERGVRFSNGYMSAPVCNPSRAGLLTGRYQQRWGKELNSQTKPPVGVRQKGALPKSELCIGNALKEQGYATCAIGKWQMGMTSGHHPLDRGFDYFFGMASGSPHVDPKWAESHILGRGAGSDEDGQLMRGRKPVNLEEYLTDQLTNEGIGFMRRNKDRPFFLYLAHYAVHSPIQTTDKYYNRFPQFKNRAKRIYAGMISALDDSVGAVMEMLEEEGMLENTLVIFTSDNGAAETSDMDGRRNAPFTGHKRNLYEGGIHVPLAIQWRGVLPEGISFEHPINSLDILPTSLAVAGVEDLSTYNLDGTNLLPYLKTSNNSPPHKYLFWRSGPNAAVRSGKWKLLLVGENLIRLYDVSNDPGELKDLSTTNPEVVEELKKAFSKWNSEMQTPRKSSRTVKTNFSGDQIDWHI